MKRRIFLQVSGATALVPAVTGAVPQKATAPQRAAPAGGGSGYLFFGKSVAVEASPDTPLLWVLRDHLGLTGTKFGCGISLCGACTVHIDGTATRSCVTPLSAAAGKTVVTIEGLSGPAGQAVQAAWDRHQVPQCGYCQSGQVMAAAALLARNPDPSDADIDQAMQGNLCRCGTYPSRRCRHHAGLGHHGWRAGAGRRWRHGTTVDRKSRGCAIGACSQQCPLKGIGYATTTVFAFTNSRIPQADCSRP